MDAESGRKHVVEYWLILRRRRWVIYLAVATVSLVALIGSFLVTPLYRSTVTLQIERLSPDILNFTDLARMDYSWAAYSDFYQTQYKIISSTDVARRAVEKLGLTNHPLFDRARSGPTLLSRLRALIPRKVPSVDLDPRDVVAQQVLAGLDVTPIRNSQLVKISWTATDPELAARTATAIADAYIEFTIESRYSTTDQAREFLLDQIGTLNREIVAMEERLQSYGESKGILTIDDSNNITLQALANIAEEQTQAETALARAKATYDGVVSVPPEALPAVMNSNLIARLREEYASYEAEQSEKSRLFRMDWPGMQKIRSKLEQARERLSLETERIATQVRANAEAEYQRALKTVNNFDRLLRSHQDAAQRLKRDAVEYASLQSEVDKKRETLNALLRRQNEMTLSTRLKDLDSTTSNIRVMERARPASAPFRPDPTLNLALGLILGLTLGVAMAFTLDYLDNTISSASELARITSMPVLAVIPRHGDAGIPFPRVRRRRADQETRSFDLIAHRDGQAGATEAYRELRTLMLLSHPGKPPRRLMVTSAVPEEGKTATALNLSVVLAQLGRRVIVVDTDLRRPRLHQAFNASNRRGVSTYLSGLEGEPSQLVVSTSIENLDLLPSGPIPPNPSELLNSEIFSALGQQLIDKGYDHVIFDSPPMLSVSDPVIIANVVDMGILVVRAGRTPRQSVRLAADRLRHSGGETSGVVLNDLDLEGQGAAYFRYERYGRYGEAERHDSDGGQRPASGSGVSS